jgi:2-alkyl-3-oxoalkanoate reductase
VFSFVHTADAAAATVASLDRGAPGIYNIVDDEPAPLAEWLPVYAEALGARPPRRVPTFLARLIAGPFATAFATELRGASNAKAKRDLGWEPSYPTWRQGFKEALG